MSTTLWQSTHTAAVRLAILLALGATTLGCPGSSDTRTRAREVDLSPVLGWSVEDLGAAEPAIVTQVESALTRLREAVDAGEDGEQLADRLGEVAMLYQLYRRTDRALEAYALASKVDPSEPRWPYYQALLLHEGGDLDDAVLALKRCLDTGTDALAPRVRLAETLMAQGNVKAAAERFEQLRNDQPESERVEVGWAEAQLALGPSSDSSSRAEALEALEALHRKEPDQRRIRLALGRARRAAGDLEGARPLLEQVESLSPEDRRLDLVDRWVQELAALNRSSEAAWNQGRGLMMQKLPEAALVKLQTAVEREPERPAYWTDLGSAQLQLGHTDEAEASYRKALALDADYIPALTQLGSLQQNRGQQREAIVTFDRILALDPARTSILLLKGEAHRLAGDLPAAIDSFTRVLELSPGDERTMIGLAAAHFEAGDTRAAAEVVAQGFEARPGSFWFRSLGLRLCALGKSADRSCRVDLEEAQLLFESRPTAFAAETLAMAYAAQGDFEAALRWQEAAVEGLGAAGSELELARRRATKYQAKSTDLSAFLPTEFSAARVQIRRPSG